MAPSDQELFAIARRAAKAFAALPNVHAVGIGGRERGGKPTGEIVLKVFVTRKLSREQLDSGSRIPAAFEGVPTDVIRVGLPVPNAAPPGAAPLDTYEEREAHRDRARERPLRGGSLIMPNDDSGVGTMGFIIEVLEDNRMVFGVTNHHVIFSSASLETPGFPVGQPDTSTSCTACCRGVIGQYTAGRESLVVHDDPQGIDYALIRLDPGLEWLNEIKDVGVVEGTYDVRVSDIVGLDYPVRKRGATTRLTGGTVHGIGVVAVPHTEPVLTVDRPRWYQHYADYSMLIRPNPPPSGPGDPVVFGTHGDSGSAVVNDGRQVVGLYWGSAHEHTITDGDPATDIFGYGFAIPVARLAADMSSRLNLTLTIHPTAGEGIVNTVPDAAGLAPPVRAEASLQRDLDATERGRAFLQAWLRHSGELNAIIQDQRRVATVWQRHNGPALLRMVARAPLEPTLPLPLEVDGVPLREGLEAFLDQVHRHASTELRQELASQRDLLLSLPGRSYLEVMAQLGGPH